MASIPDFKTELGKYFSEKDEFFPKELDLVPPFGASAT